MFNENTGLLINTKVFLIICRTFSEHKLKETDAVKWQIKQPTVSFFRKEQSELDLLIDHELDHISNMLTI